MTEIKFRAWNKEIEEFIYSDCYYDYAWFQFEDGKLKAYAMHGEIAGDIHTPPEPYCEELEPPEQFTCLKDKNNREIFEGDICRASHPDSNVYYIGEIGWDNEHPTFFLLQKYYASLPLFYYDEFEIIGNIHENPELLE